MKLLAVLLAAVVAVAGSALLELEGWSRFGWGLLVGIVLAVYLRRS